MTAGFGNPAGAAGVIIFFRFPKPGGSDAEQSARIYEVRH